MPVPVLSIPVWSLFVEGIQWCLRVCADFTGNAALSVIVLTIVFKTLVLPLTIKSVRSMYGMQELQPKLKELQKKYKGDKQKQQAETMKLYQENGVNPMSGCLPMLLQMPIFFGLYFAIENLSRHGGGTWQQSFFWIPSLAAADPLHILPILAGVFQFIQTKMTRPAHQGKVTDPQQKMMNNMMMFMPLMVVAFGWGFSTGPVIYWVVSAIYSAIQQWFITGWGSMLDWMPFLPDLPEHRRLGYVTPEQKARMIEKSKNSETFFSKMSRKMQEQAGMQQDEDEEERSTPAPAARTTKSGAKKKGTGGKAPAPAAPIPPGLVPRKSHGGQSLKATHNGVGAADDQSIDGEEEPVVAKSELTPRRNRRARDAQAKAQAQAQSEAPEHSEQENETPTPDERPKMNGNGLRPRRTANRSGNGKVHRSNGIENGDGHDRDEAIIGERRQGEHGADEDEER